MIEEFALTSQERQATEKERKDAQDERRAASQAREQDKDGWNRAQQERDGISFSAVALISLALQKEKILNWLSSADCNARHSTVGDTHAENTGIWLLEELKPWFEGGGPRLVICKGAGIFFDVTS